MLQLLDDYDGSLEAQRQFLAGCVRCLEDVHARMGRGDRAQVLRAEDAVKADPRRCIRFNAAGAATIYAAGRRYQGGLFETPRLCELQSQALAARERAGRPATRLSLWVFDGVSLLTDIGALQATAAPSSLFQVASQFNCLESTGRFVSAVADYLHDPTQGPRASISAFPGALVRHYAAPAPDGSRFVQTTDGPQVELLADLCNAAPGNAAPGDAAPARVRSGYLSAQDIAEPLAFARALEEQFMAVRVGVHDGIEVVLGAEWDGGVDAAPHRTIAQVCTSTLAAGMYGGLDVGDSVWLQICRQLQRAAYLGTLLAAAALGKERVVLTLIGGGVFANPIPLIWEAIRWAMGRLRPMLHRDLTVVVNGRNISEQVPAAELRAAARACGGELVRWDRSGATVSTA